MKTALRTLVGLGALIANAQLLVACGEDESADFPQSTCDQECQDGSVIFALGLSVDDSLYNEEVVGQALPRAGVACPGGGTVDISGGGSSSGGTQTLDLTFVMTDCRFADYGSDITYSGTLHYVGHFNNETGEKNLAYTSPSLTWAGAVGYATPPRFPVGGDACAVAMVRNPGVSGSLCGRPTAQGRIPPAS